MKRGGRLSAALFRAVCLGFSALLLVLTLFCQIRLFTAEREIAKLNTALDEAENTRVLLNIQIDRALGLEELERRALRELGMRRPEPGQIIEIEYLG
ncbi:MAG: hypothetical protein IJT29_04340 [Oscillospiraceae bacterium]|nr:hypothetical protein [Oscillospiraceae bacterium]